jgi:DMSO/TMAO reductase YedYZ molybdopterin-dependent catalytic subunit
MKTVETMQRRQFTLLMAAIAGRAALACSPLGLLLKRAWAQARRRLLSAQTELGSLIYEDPDLLDPRQLPITPIAQFDTMGLTQHPVDLDRWRLTITGAVARPLTFSLDQIKALPVIERDVLLICPGAFAYYARWRGASLNAMLQQAGISPRATHVEVAGPSGESAKTEPFPLDEIRADKVFLAYAVNGEPLPEKHGFPLRVVAEHRAGYQWIKFADKVEVKDRGPVPLSRVDQDKSQTPAFVP